jgi:hypothetical protein
MNDEQETGNGQSKRQVSPFRKKISRKGKKQKSNRIRKVVGDGETRTIFLTGILGDESEERVEDAGTAEA